MKNLIESIKQMYQPQAEATMMKNDGSVTHNCAKHVEHAQYGRGATIAEEHADPDRYGNIAWYDIEFPHGVERGVPVSELKVLQAESHGHSTKKAKKMAEEEDLSNAKKNGKKKDDDLPFDADDQPMDKDEFGNTIKNKARHLARKGMRQAMDVKEQLTFVLTQEEFDQLDELSKSTLASYAKKASHDARMKMTLGKDFERVGAASRKPAYKAGAKEWEDKYKSDARKREAGVYKAVDRLAKEEFEADADETVIYAEQYYSIAEAQKSSGYDAHFRAMMTKHGIKHPGELDTPEKKKAFFNKVDASYKAKNEDVFLEAALIEAHEDIKAAHRKAGNRVSDEKSGTKDGKAFHSFVVTQPSGKRTRHIYHGTTKKLETMSPAARSKESSEQDLDDK